MTDGRLSPSAAISPEKIQILREYYPALTACKGENTPVVGILRQPFGHAHSVVPETLEELDCAGGDMLVGKNSHETETVCSLASHAPYFAACCTSSRVSSG